MGAHIEVLSRREAEARTFTESEAVVSISDPTSPGYPGGPPPRILGTPHVLYLRFDDGYADLYDKHREEYRAQHGRYPYRLEEPAALAVIAFARAHAAAGRSIVVHCEAGLSRSPGMAEALDLILNGAVACIKPQHRPYSPVKSTMLRAAGMVPHEEAST